MLRSFLIGAVIGGSIQGVQIYRNIRQMERTLGCEVKLGLKNPFQNNQKEEDKQC